MKNSRRASIRVVKGSIRVLVNELNNGCTGYNQRVMVSEELMRVTYGASDTERVSRTFQFWEDMRDFIAENGHKFEVFSTAEVPKHADK